MGHRIKVVKDKNFTVIHNGYLNNPNLSWKAKGIMTFCLSLPDDWELYLEHLKNVSKDGRDSTSNGVKELLSNNYLTRIRKRKGQGKFEGFDYTLHEVPMESGTSPKTGFPISDNPNSDNPTLLNTDKELNTDNTKDEEQGSSFHQKKGGKLVINVKGLFPAAVDVYVNFLKKNDLTMKKSPAEFKAMKEILSWFIDYWMEKKTWSEEEIKDNVLKSLTAVFSSWDSLEPFYRDKVKLIQINSNLINIITQLRNGRQQQNGFKKKNQGGFPDQIDNQEMVSYLKG